MNELLSFHAVMQHEYDNLILSFIRYYDAIYNLENETFQ